MKLSKGAIRSLTFVAAFAVLVMLVYNLWDGRKTLAVLNFGLRYSIPLILAAIAGLMCERTGVVNIGIEGQMLAAAFTGFFVSAAWGVWAGIVAAVFVGFLTGVFLALCAVRWRIDQIIAGTVINTMAAGFTSFFYQQGKTLKGRLPQFDIPGLSDIPIIGPVFFRELGPIAWTALILIFVMNVLVFRTRWGLRSRAVGEHPSAADTVGIPVEKFRYMNTSLAGALAGMAGAFIAIESSGSFSRGMTNGRGFLALAIMIMGRWRPMLAAASAGFFGLMFGITNQLQFDKVIEIPPQFISMTPYILTIVVLAVFSGRVRPPAAAGTPYVKE
jgi:general nucleoside transport system permease protein